MRWGRTISVNILKFFGGGLGGESLITACEPPQWGLTQSDICSIVYLSDDKYTLVVDILGIIQLHSNSIQEQEISSQSNLLSYSSGLPLAVCAADGKLLVVLIVSF